MLIYYDFINSLLLFTAMAIFISSLDDFFIDLCYWVRRVYRYFKLKNIRKPITLEMLKNKPEQPIALMVPAWQESEVIAKMLEANLKFIDYQHYFFFVGVYQNDPATGAEVDKMVARHSNIKKVVVPNDGPTCKADCLNWIIQAIFLYEKNTSLDFSMIVMHDSEDIIHPLELRLFNYLAPRKDLIQIPLRCLETKWHEFIRGSYLDEFAEFHSKDMVIREDLLGVIPSAGVASCFSKRAIKALCSENEGQPFSTDTLTEDYDVSYRIAEHPGMSQIFVTFPVSVAITKELYPKAHAKKLHREIPVAVAEYFPNKLWPAIRQKTRWNIGIFFQAIGLSPTWTGGFFRKYYFIHDRKGILTNIIMFPAYFLLINIVVFWLGGNLLGWPYYIFDMPAWLAVANLILLLNRAIHRVYFTTYLYDWRQGLLSIPRILFSNVINFSSTARGTWFYLRHLITGQPIAWDKTTHEYPSLDVLASSYKKLGDLLKEKNLVGETQLELLLQEQKICRLPLGQLLLRKGILDEDELWDVLSAQTNYARGQLEQACLETAMNLLDSSLILNYEVFPVEVSGQRMLTLLTTRAINEDTRKAILAKGYLSITPLIILERDMERLLNQVRRQAGDRKLLGDLLMEKNILNEESLDDLLAQQRAEQNTIGALLVAKGILTAEELLELLSEQIGYRPGQLNEAPEVEDALELLHPSIILNNRVYPVRVAPETGRLTLLCARELSPRDKMALATWGYRDLEPTLLSEVDLGHLLDMVQEFETAHSAADTEGIEEADLTRLGNILVDQKLIDQRQLTHCLNEQKTQQSQLGAIFVAKGFITEEELNNALARQKPEGGSQGAYSNSLLKKH